MKSVRRIVSRTLSGDGGPRTAATRKGRSPRRVRSQNKPTAVDETETRIFCNDMYTVDFVRDSIDVVAKDSTVDSIILEDLIERNHPSITQAVHDLFVNTTQSAKMEGHLEDEENAESAALERKGSNGSLVGSGSHHNGSNINIFGAGKRKKKENDQPQRRVWKNIVFLDSISDSESYEAYLNQKRDFVSALTRFLKAKGFQNDLPIRFEARIEIHILLEATTILQLLHRILRDSTVTRVEFEGALSHTRRIPEEFEKLIDPESLTVTDMVMIHLHYDKQSINIDEEEENATKPKGQKRRVSQLNTHMLTTIQRCSWILESKLNPGLDSSFMKGSESESSDFNFNLLSGSRNESMNNNPEPVDEEEKGLDDSFARALDQSLMDDLANFDESSHSHSKKIEPKRSNSKTMEDSSTHSEGANARRERPQPPFKRSLTDGPSKAHSPPHTSSSAKAQRPIRLNVLSVDASIWEKGLDKTLLQEDASAGNSRIIRKTSKTKKVTPPSSPSDKQESRGKSSSRSPPRRSTSEKKSRSSSGSNMKNQKSNSPMSATPEHNALSQKKKKKDGAPMSGTSEHSAVTKKKNKQDGSPPPPVRRATSSTPTAKEEGSPPPLVRRATSYDTPTKRKVKKSHSGQNNRVGHSREGDPEFDWSNPTSSLKGGEDPEFDWSNPSLKGDEEGAEFDWDGFLKEQQ